MEQNPSGGRRGMPVWAIVLLVIVALLSTIAIIAAILARLREDVRAASCESSMKQISLALCLYSEEYAGTYPFSPKSKADATFETAVGSANRQSRADSLAAAMYPYLRDSYAFLCPSDDIASVMPMSYYYKHAVNLAARKGLKEPDFHYPARQIVLYERRAFHHRRGPIVDGARVNAAYIDGHVRMTRLRDVGADSEPMYFNALDTSDPKAANIRKPYWDPRCCYDKLW